MPQISIITVTLNVCKVIENCILSVYNQHFTEYEHIIIDGGSTDGTIEILKGYSHLKWVSEPDNGIYDAMNKGLSLATGEWIYFLGSDDILMSGILNKVFPNNNSSPYDFIYGNVEFQSSHKIYDGEFNIQKLLTRNICHQAIFYRKTLLEDMGCFDARYSLWADYIFNIRVFSSNVKVEYINDIIALYNEDGKSGKFVDLIFVRESKHLFLKYFGKLTTKKDIANALIPCMYELVKAGKYLSAFLFLPFITIHTKSARSVKDFIHLALSYGK